MVTFTFKRFTTSGRKKAVKDYEVIQANIKGEIIKEDETIKVKIGDKTYLLTEDSYSCKGKKEVWYQPNRDKYGHRIKIIRKEIDDRCSMDKRYAPFSVGLPCWGDLIKEPLKSPIFRLKKCINPNIY